MHAARYRKKPVVIEAIQWTGSNQVQVTDFMGASPTFGSDIRGSFVSIMTLEGEMRADQGDWIIREPFPTGDRQFYPCKPDIFEATYEAVDA